MPNHLADSDPYPWPFDGQVDGRSLVLLLCGLQRGLVDASPGAAEAIERLDDAAQHVRRVGGRVIWIRHGSRQAPTRPTAWLPTRHTTAWQLAVTADPGDEIVDSAGWDGCFGSDLDQTLRSSRARCIVIGGCASEITVDSTLRTLNDRGLECLVLTDGCAPLDPLTGSRAHASVTMSGGIFGALGTTSSLLHLLSGLQPDPLTPHRSPTKETSS